MRSCSPRRFNTCVLAAASVFALSITNAAAQASGREVAPIASFDSAWAAIGRTYWDAALLDGAWRVARDSLRTALADGWGGSMMASATC